MRTLVEKNENIPERQEIQRYFIPAVLIKDIDYNNFNGNVILKKDTLIYVDLSISAAIHTETGDQFDIFPDEYTLVL